MTLKFGIHITLLSLFLAGAGVQVYADAPPPEYEESNKLVMLGIKAFRAGQQAEAEKKYLAALHALESLNGPKTDLARMAIHKNLHLLYTQQGRTDAANEQIQEISTIERGCGLPLSHKAFVDHSQAAGGQKLQELKAEPVGQLGKSTGKTPEPLSAAGLAIKIKATDSSQKKP